MDTEKDTLYQRLKRDEITVSEYMEGIAQIDGLRAKQIQLEEQEQVAKSVEKAILQAGGVAQRRDYAQIPNPWSAEHKNLTNQHALIRNNRELADQLQMQAGLPIGDRRMQELLAEQKRVEERVRMAAATAKMRELNDQRLGRQQPHEDFIDAIEDSRRKNAHIIPYFGGR
jgi:hypothetical protein